MILEGVRGGCNLDEPVKKGISNSKTVTGQEQKANLPQFTSVS